MPTVLSRDQVRQVDKLAVEQLGMPSIILMENAARNTAAQVLAFRRDEIGRGPVAVLCGGGNNGGDGYAIARHLHNHGMDVRLYALKDPDDLDGDAQVNHRICHHMELPIETVTDDAAIERATADWSRATVLIDALLGTGFSGEVRGLLAAAIHRVNELHPRPLVVAVDVPSGLDCQSGEPSDATMHADLTVTFVAVKAGFEVDAARAYVGQLAVVDIGTPPALIEQVLGERGRP